MGVNQPADHLLIDERNHGKLETITIYRKDLETEHRQLLSRLQYLRQLLGYPALNTGHQIRLAERK